MLSYQWDTEKDSPVLEGRSAAQRARHLLRDEESQEERLLIMGDALCFDLAQSKGRKSAPNLLRPVDLVALFCWLLALMVLSGGHLRSAVPLTKVHAGEATAALSVGVATGRTALTKMQVTRPVAGQSAP